MYDLIIVGAGPAGCAAGRIAGQRGLTTLMIDRQTFPRYKACGGALSEQAMSYLDFDIPSHLQERDVYGARVHFQERVVETHKKYRIATMVTRSALDAFLLEKAKETGIEIRTGERILAFEEKADCVHVHSKDAVYDARFLIVGEGAHGRLKNRVRRRDTKREYGICVVAEVPAENDEIDRYIYDSIAIHFGVANMGYGWVFPHQRYFSVGIGGIAGRLKDPIATMNNFLMESGFEDDYDLRGHLIPVGGINRNLSGKRAILIGDAAGFVDSFCGEGLAYAIRSGQIASEIVSKIVQGGCGPNAVQEYGQRCEIEFGRNLRHSLMLSRMMHALPKLFFGILTGDNRVLDRYLEVVAGRRTYQSFIKWLLPRVPRYLVKSLWR